jgi:cell filamentation protein
MPNYEDAKGELKNKLGAHNFDELTERSDEFINFRIAQIISGRGPRGNFDEQHLRAVHHHLFQDVFEWAGRIRDDKVQLSDGTVAFEPVFSKGGHAFLPARLIPTTLQNTFRQLHAESFFRATSDEVFIDRMANLLNDINTIHPFREGNGRTQRVFIQALAKQSGRKLDFAGITKERNIEASIAASKGDLSGFKEMLRDAMAPERTAVLEKIIVAFSKTEKGQNFIQGHSLKIAEQGFTGTVTYGARDATTFMFKDPKQSGFVVAHIKDLPSAEVKGGETIKVVIKTPLEKPQQAAQQKPHLRSVRRQDKDNDHGR